jgi:hypothetical protein
MIARERQREREREREREDSSKTSPPIMLIPLPPASPPTKPQQPFSRDVKNFYQFCFSEQWGEKHDKKLMKYVRCLTCRQKGQRLTVQNRTVDDKSSGEKEANRQNMEKRETGHIYSTVFHSSISTRY